MNEFIELKKLHQYFKKAINTNLKENTLNSKSKQADELFKTLEIKFIKNIDKISQDDANSMIISAKKFYTEIKNIIKLKLQLIHQNTHQKTTISHFEIAKIKSCNMVDENENAAAVAFDIKQATAIVQPYDGTVAGFESFIDSVNFLKDLIQPNHMAMAVRFIKTRLSGKARNGFPDNIATIDALIDHIKAKCKDTTTPDTIIAKLNATKQRGQLTSFCEEIENLCNKLENCCIMQEVPENVAKTMSTKAGVTALISGISASDTKLILKAGNFTCIKDALQKAQECTNDASTSQIFNVLSRLNFVRQNPTSNFRGNGFNRNRNFRRNNFNPRPQQNYYQHQQGYYQSQRGKYQRGGFNNRGRFNDNRPRYDNSNRVYMANVDQPSGPPQNQNREGNNGQQHRPVQQNQQQPQNNFLGQY